MPCPLVRVMILGLALLSACSKHSSSSGGGGGAAVATASQVVKPLKYYNFYPFNNVYTLPVGIGGESVEAVLDTGSANLLAIGDSAHCKNCVNAYGYSSIYTPTAASKQLATSWSISFLPIGEAQVQGYADTLTFNGLTVKSYPFGLVTSELNIPNIWGIAYQSGASPESDPQLPPFDALMAAGNWANQFSLRLCALKNGSNITLGGFDSSVPTGSAKILWTPVVERQAYDVGVSRMYITGTGTTASPQWVWAPTGSEPIIVDSGTNPIVIPSAMIPTLVNLLSSTAVSLGLTIPLSFWPTATAKGGFATIAAADVAKFPTIQLEMTNFSGSGKTITLSIQPSTYFQTRQDGARFLGFEGGSGTYILGTVFMENYVVLFDRGNPDMTVLNDPTARVGFYPNAGLCN